MTVYLPDKAPRRILQELGITEPGHIDIEAICQYCGATVVYERLKGCEGRILGHGDRSIITVNSNAPRGRQRFTAAHELGHWMCDRGRVSYACTEQTLAGAWGSESLERTANQFVADILLPEIVFSPAADAREVTVPTVRELAAEFQTSLTATAIRLVEFGSYPAMVVCTENGRRKWFRRSPLVPKSVWPLEEPGPESLTGDILKGEAAEVGPDEIYANQWVDLEDAGHHVLVESCVRVSPNHTLTLLWWEDEQQLLDLDREES